MAAVRLAMPAEDARATVLDARLSCPHLTRRKLTAQLLLCAKPRSLRSTKCRGFRKSPTFAAMISDEDSALRCVSKANRCRFTAASRGKQCLFLPSFAHHFFFVTCTSVFKPKL